METGLFIRGRWDTKWGVKTGQNRAGIPARAEGGPFLFRFPIADRLTAYEWAMALADRHPYPHHFAMLFGDLMAGTFAGMQNREDALKTLSPLSNAIFRELRADVEATRIVPLRREFCADDSDVLDFTRCVFGIDQVLALVRRRGDTGWLIGKLLAMDTAGTTDQADGQAIPQGDTLRPAPVRPPAPGRKRGPRPVKRLRVETAMRDNIGDDSGKAQTLRLAKEEELATTHNVSRDTARRARANVLSEFELRQTSTIDK